MTTANPFDNTAPDERARQMIRALEKIGAELENIRYELAYMRDRLP